MYIALSEQVVCLVITRGDFTRMLGNLNEIIEGWAPQRLPRVSTIALQKQVSYKVQDLEMLSTLGQGTFSKTKLVKAKDTGVYYALKMLGKESILENNQSWIYSHSV